MPALFEIDEYELQRIEHLISKRHDYSCFYDELKTNKIKIYAYFTKEYEILNYIIKTKCIVYKIKILNNQFYAIKNDDIKDIIAYFIYKRDSSSDENEMRKYYKDSYDIINTFLSLDKKEKQTFRSAYKNFNLISHSLKQNKVRYESATLNRLILKRNIKYITFNDIDIKLITDSSFEKIIDINHFFSTYYFNQNNSINKYSFSKEDQFFFDTLYNKMITNSNKNNLVANSIIDLFLAYPRRHIDIKNRTYRLDKIISNIDIYISSTYRIVTDIKNDEIECEDNQFILLCNKETETFYFKKFNSSQEKLLFDFSIKYPNLPYNLLEEEIETYLLPNLNKNIAVSTNILNKAKNYISEIQYFIDYEDNLKDEKLILSTSYLINGKKVNSIDYSSYNREEYDSFIDELNNLNLLQNEEITNKDKIYEILSLNLNSLNSICRIFLSDNLKAIKHKSTINYKVISKSNIDWFQIELESDEYSQEELQLILQAYEKGKKYIKLKDSILSLKSKENEERLSILDRYDLTSSLQSKKIPLYQAVKLKEFNQLNIDVDYSNKLKELFNNLKNYKHIDYKFKTDNLKPYQIDAVKWLYTIYSNNLSGILADDMGLGKSLELISFLDSISFNQPILIVSPKSIIYNWQNEFNKWDSKKNITVISSNKSERNKLYEQMENKKDSVYIISYDSLRNDITSIKDINFSLVVLDEGQYISNAFALKTMAVKQLKAKNKFVLTGTPISNSLLDLWSIFDFILPNYFENYSEFSKKYIKENNNYDENIKRLELLIEPFILRRNKKEVLNELPDKQIENIYINLNNEEEKTYKAFLYKAREDSSSKNKKIEVLADLTRLREICVDMSMIANNNITPSKLEYSLSLIKNAIKSNHKVVVFSSFVKVLEHFEKLLKSDNISFNKIIGSTPAKERVLLSDRFNYEHDIKVMLVSLKAGGNGLNLIGADIALHLDPWWNEAVENQASDRIYRIGQKNSVTIYKLIAKNTIEEKVLLLKEKKKELSTLIHDENSAKKSFTDDDIKFILS